MVRSGNGEGGLPPTWTSMAPSVTIPPPLAQTEAGDLSPDLMNLLYGDDNLCLSMSELFDGGGMAEHDHDALPRDTNQCARFSISPVLSPANLLHSPSSKVQPHVSTSFTQVFVANSSTVQHVLPPTLSTTTQSLEQKLHSSPANVDNFQENGYNWMNYENKQDYTRMSQQQAQPHVSTSFTQVGVATSSISQQVLPPTLSTNTRSLEQRLHYSSMNADNFQENGYNWMKYGNMQEYIGMSQQRAQPQVSASFPQVFTNTSGIAQQVLPLTLSATTDSLEQGINYSPVNVSKFNDDGYNWIKYGEKKVKCFLFTQIFYMCSQHDCPAKKKVEHSPNGSVTDINYKGKHNHQPPNPSLAANATVACNINSNVQGTSERQEARGQETQMVENNFEPYPKRRNTGVNLFDPTSSRDKVSKPRFVVQTISDTDILDDGYKWRKYGQKVVKGNTNPRSYYKCASVYCNVRKHVERAPTDPRAVLATYEGIHNHDVPPPKTDSLIVPRVAATGFGSNHSHNISKG